MKRLVLVLSVVCAAWMLSPTPEAQAWSWSGRIDSQETSKKQKRAALVERIRLAKANRGGAAVPELDPSATGSAMVLLLGGTAWIASRRREEDLP